MLNIEYKEEFLKRIEKIRDPVTKEKMKKQILKIINLPEIGKPMMYERKGTRELYVSPYRLAYAYISEEEKIIFLDVYHKDEQ